MKELVVARFVEDLRWLRRVPGNLRILIYNKGDLFALPEVLDKRSELKTICLPNIGREAHSYLTHVVEQYDSLAEITIFCQGHPFDHAPDFHQSLKLLAEETTMDIPFRWYGFLEESDDPLGRRLFVPWSKNPERRELSTGRLYEKLFCKPTPELFYFRGGAQFAVCREAVMRRPKEFYQRALRLSLEIPDAAHSIERFWDQIFCERVIAPADLGREGVRYLKKIRRLENAE